MLFSLRVVPPFQGQANVLEPTLGDLKAHLSQITSIPYNEIKLVYHGLILKDDSLPLHAYNIRSEAKTMLIGTSGGAGVGDRPGDKVSQHAEGSDRSSSGRRGGRGADGDTPRSLTKGELLAQERRRKEADRSEKGVATRIDEVLKTISEELEPQLTSLEQRIANLSNIPPAASVSAAGTQAPVVFAQPDAAAASSSACAPSQRSLLHFQQLLNELFSRSLLQLDAIPTVSEDTRRQRKEAVRSVQSLIDRLDKAWEQVPAEEKWKE